MGLFETWLKNVRKHSLKTKKRRLRAVQHVCTREDEENTVAREQLGSRKIDRKHVGCGEIRDNEKERPRKRQKRCLERVENAKGDDNGDEIGGREDGNCESYRASENDGVTQKRTLLVDEFEQLTGLKIVRSLQSKDVPLERKIELAFLFVESLKNQEQSVNLNFQWKKSWMGMPQLVLFLCDWIQSILILSTKQNITLQKSIQKDAGPTSEGSNLKILPEAFLDVRCWVVFKWCLQSKYLERSSVSPNLMRSLNSVLTVAAAFPGGVSNRGSPCIPNKSAKPEPETVVKGVLMKEFTEVIAALFSLHGRYFRPTLDLWAASVLAAVCLAQRVFSEETSDDWQIILLKLAGLILEAFAKFLGSHPNPRNAFPVIVEKLLEPLLSLLADLRDKFSSKECLKNDITYIWRLKLLGALDDVFANGLFHPVHIDGYLNVCKIDMSNESLRSVKAKKKDKLVSSGEHEREDSNTSFASYHKLFFQKLDWMRREGRTAALYGIGWLLRVFIRRKKYQGAVAPELICTGKIETSRISGDYQKLCNSDQNKSQHRSIITDFFTESSGSAAQIGKASESKHTAVEPDIHSSKQEEATIAPLFNLFGEFVEPLRIDLETCTKTVQLEEGVTSAHLLRVQSVVVAVNSLLAVVKDEKIYRPTEDTPGQAHLNFLKKIYNTIFELGTILPNLWLKLAPEISKVNFKGYEKSLGSNQYIANLDFENILMIIRKEVILALNCLLEIEYRVAKDELLNLWLLLLSYLSLDSSRSHGEWDDQMLTRDIVQLGCQIISIYGELRQVERPLFSLFKSFRFFTFFNCNNSIEVVDRQLMSFIDSLPSVPCIGAVTSLACSQKFQNLVASVICVMPEGQVAQCIRLLKVDFMESLGWMNIPCIKDKVEESQIMEAENITKQRSIVQAEVIGKALSELYALILDNSNVTMNNSIQVGGSVKEMVAGFSPCLGTLVDGALKHAKNRWQDVLSIFTGREIDEERECGDMNMQPATLIGGSWVMVFIFRLYLSCRSLYRQCICLMPPNPGKKASLAMCDSFTAYSGNDCIQKGVALAQGGYFSWIGKPSVPVQSVLISISESLEQYGFERVPALLYVLHNIALQRLADLNRELKALEFLHDRNLRLKCAKAETDGDSTIQCKERKQFVKLLDVLKEEASDLTEFILKCIFSSVKTEVGSHSYTVGVGDENKGDAQSSNKHSGWNLVIGTLNESSLVTGVWKLLCQSVDIWSSHASKKSMKKFASKLLGSSLAQLKNVSQDVDLQHVSKHIQHEEKLVMMEDISLELLRNTVLYEQESFCRYLAPKICQKLKKSSPSGLNPSLLSGISSSGVIFGDLHDWTLVLDMLENEITAIGEVDSSSYENIKKNEHGSTLVTIPVSEVATKENQAPLISSERTFGDWICLLNLLCWLPKGYGDVKCLSMYVRRILNIERFLVITFLRTCQSSHCDVSAMLKSSGTYHPREYLELFLACRRALKSLAMTFNEDEVEVRRSSLVPILLENSSSCLWLLRSIDVAAECFSKCSSIWKLSSQGVWENHVNSGKEIIFSILNYTAGTLMLICEDLFKVAARSSICHAEPALGMRRDENHRSSTMNFENHLKSEREEHMDIQTPMDVLAKALVMQARNALVFLKQRNFDINLDANESISTSKSKVDGMSHTRHGLGGGRINSGSWIGVTALTCGIRSILLGLASALGNLDEQCRRDRTGSLKWRCDLFSKWERRIDDFEHFINFCVNKFLVGHGFDETSILERDVVSGINGSSAPCGQDVDAELLKQCGEAEEMENKFGQELESEVEEVKDGEEQNKLYDYLDGCDAKKDEDDGNLEDQKSQFILDNIESDALKDDGQWLDFVQMTYLNKSLLGKMLKGERWDEANLLGELFIALAGIVKLKHLSSSPKILEAKKVSHSASLAFMNLHVGAAHWLISEAVAMTGSSNTFSLGWLVGIVRYLETIGSFIPYMNPVFPRTVYVKLINLHLQAMATLCFPYYGQKKSSHFEEIGYNNNKFHSLEDRTCKKASVSEIGSYGINGLKAALESSFSMLVRKPLQLHLILALHSIEHALAGVWKEYNNVSGLHTGSPRGGKVGRIVAAGVECFNLVLESVSGPKRLKLLAKYSSNFVAALTNIVVHVQGPYIFFGNSMNDCQDNGYVEPASVILACLEVLSKIATRHAVFPMTAGHVAQSLALPAMLFQHFCQFKDSPKMFVPGEAIDSIKGSLLLERSFVVEKRLSVQLYVACCKLLSSVLRHRKRESGHCVALLGDSLRILIFCLETVEVKDSGKVGASFWSIQERVSCASWLKRVYEEMGQQKDVLGRYCSHILSDYICVVSGFGPARTALDREIDGTLRPGIYALVDACSLDDLQQLHADLGEGPRRSALQTLRHDYEHNFKYTGKI